MKSTGSIQLLSVPRKRPRWTLNPYSSANRLHVHLLQQNFSSAGGADTSVTVPLSWLKRRRSPRLWNSQAIEAAAATVMLRARCNHQSLVATPFAGETSVYSRDQTAPSSLPLSAGGSIVEPVPASLFCSLSGLLKLESFLCTDSVELPDEGWKEEGNYAVAERKVKTEGIRAQRSVAVLGDTEQR